ncbi:hypothetical protein AB833_10415 [Chromatiales bacterium (ex Bugula neritina AB1)]|nr:hypothetical protein AB833_10415 [Chromatiales bacterium (ex Bugula neritina AB1)]
MPSRGLVCICAAALAVAVACFYAIDKRIQYIAPQTRAGSPVFPELAGAVSEVTHIEITRNGRHFVLQRQGGHWQNMALAGYPAISAHVDSLITSLAGLTYISAKTTRPSLYARLQVEDPVLGAASTRCVLKTADGVELASLIAGRVSDNRIAPGRQGVYIRLPDDERSWLAEGVLDIARDAVQWSAREVVNIDAGLITALRVQQSDGHRIALEKSGTRMTLSNLPADSVVRNQYQIDYMSGLLESVTFTDVRPAAIDRPVKTSAYRAEVITDTGLMLEIQVDEVADDGSAWVRFMARAALESISDDSQQQIDRLNSALKGWSVRLPRKFADRLAIRLDDIIELKTNERLTQ